MEPSKDPELIQPNKNGEPSSSAYYGQTVLPSPDHLPPGMLTQATPAQPDTPVSPSMPTPQTPVAPKRPTHKKLIVIIIAVILILAAIAVWLFVFVNNDQSNSVLSTGTQASAQYANIPKYDSIASVATFDGSTWYAARGGVIRNDGGKITFYGTAQGVPNGSPQNIVVYNKRLWLSTQNGFAYLKSDGSSFVASNIPNEQSGIANGALFVDQVSNTMYASTFDGFYSYDAKSNTWTIITGLKNIQNFAANKDYIAVYASQPGWPIWIHTKSTGTWQKRSPAIEEQTGTVVSLNNQVLLFGRTRGYTNCDQAGKLTATSSFKLDETGNWQPVTAFNQDLTRPELAVMNNLSNEVVAKSTPCAVGEPTKLYTLSYDKDNIQLKEEKVADSTDLRVTGNSVEQNKYISEISDAAKLHPSMQVYDVDGNGNVIYGYNDNYSASSTVDYPYIAVADHDDFTESQELLMLDLKDRVNYPVMCGQGKARRLTYVFSGQLQTDRTASEGYANGLWSSTVLYHIKGAELTKVADLGGDVAGPVFACDDNRISWLGKTGLRQMNRSTNAMSQVGGVLGSNLQYSQTSASVTPNGNMWFSTNADAPNTSKLYYFDATKNTASLIAGNIDITSLQASSDRHVIVKATQNKDTRQSVYDSAGKLDQEVGAFGPAAYAAPTDSFLVLKDENAASPNSVGQSFNINSLKVGSELKKYSGKNDGFTSRDINAGYSVYPRPVLIYDSMNSRIWLNDATYGINGIGIAKEIRTQGSQTQ